MPEKKVVPPLTVKEVANQLGISEGFVRGLCVNRLIRHARIGYGKRISYRFRQEWVDEYSSTIIIEPVQQGGHTDGKAKK